MSLRDSPVQRAATIDDAGRTCPYCRFALKPGAALAECAVCHARHHDECWTDNRGCAVLGCRAGPGRPSPEPAGAAPPASRGPATPHESDPAYSPRPAPYSTAPRSVSPPEMPGDHAATEAAGGGYPRRLAGQKAITVALLAVAAAIIGLAVVVLTSKGPRTAGEWRSRPNQQPGLPGQDNDPHSRPYTAYHSGLARLRGRL